MHTYHPSKATFCLFLVSTVGRMSKLLLILLISLAYFTANAQSPTANFTALPLSVCAGVPVNFTSTSTTNGGPAITQYSWNFGDGSSTVTTLNPIHDFRPNPGTGNLTYNISLISTNTFG